MADHLPMKARASLGVAIAVACCIGAACVSESLAPTPEPLDDAGPSPRPSASVADAARADASGADAVADPGAMHLQGDWVPVGTLPAECRLQMSTTPEKIPAFPWKPCNNGVPGCEAFTADWDQGVNDAFSPSGIEPVYEDQNGVHVTYRRGIKFADSFAHIVVQNMTGPAEKAFAVAAAGCGMIGHTSKAGTALAFVGRGEQGYLGWDDASGITTVNAPVTKSLWLHQNVVRGDGRIAVETTNLAGPVVAAAFDIAGRSFFGPAANHSGESRRPLLVQGGMLALVGGLNAAVAYVPNGGGSQVLAQPSAGQFIDSLAVDRASNDDIVWTETPDDVVRTVWTSPLARTQADLRPRKVAVLEYSYRAVFNGGVGLAAYGPQEARLFRLSDGLGWKFPAVPGLRYIEALWVNNDAAWILASKVNNGGTPFNSVVKFSRAALGAPTEPSGL